MHVLADDLLSHCSFHRPLLRSSIFYSERKLKDIFLTDLSVGIFKLAGFFGSCGIDEAGYSSPLVPDTTTRNRLQTCCTTPPADELTTVLQLVVQQIHHQGTNICHIPTS